ncbi:MAG TPA: phosphoglycolate phosphatase [Limnobacter sp.]|nr:phosphoglycolate phosphatase [Limnobacter sp.]
MNKKAVLFDLDGTLLHTVPDLAAAVNAMLADLGKPTLPEETVAVYVGKGAENLVNRSLTGSMTEKADPVLYQQAMANWQNHYTHINGNHSEFYPGVKEGLELLKQAGCKLAVVTNKPERFTHPLLQRTGIADYFEVVVGGDTCPVKKPDPMPILHACKLLGIQPSQALMIGDSVNDALSAHAAGVECWLLPYGYNEGNSVMETRCDGVVNTIQEAAERLLGQYSARPLEQSARPLAS